MRATVDLQAVTDRVLGLAPPLPAARFRRSPRKDAAVLLAMFLTSMAGSAGGFSLWMLGHGVAGLRVFCGAVLFLLVLLRFR